MKPIIGLTPTPSDDAFDHGTFHRFALADTYTGAVAHAGGIPVILPPQADAYDEIFGMIDGLVLTGGADIDPKRYGDATRHPATYGVDAARDQFEIDLVHGALERNIPILCICRGIQLLNVALGGTLIQDIADEYPGAIEHRQQANRLPIDAPSHPVIIEPGSLLAEVYGPGPIPANSFHHQAVRVPGDGLRVVGRTPDGLIEALELTGSTWVLGVQWHPEMMFRSHPEHLRPFQALVHAATQRLMSQERAARVST